MKKNIKILVLKPIGYIMNQGEVLTFEDEKNKVSFYRTKEEEEELEFVTTLQKVAVLDFIKNGALKLVEGNFEKTDRPVLLEKRNYKTLTETLEGYLDYLESPEFSEDNDFETYIYEETLKAFYGDKVFDFINSRMV